MNLLGFPILSLLLLLPAIGGLTLLLLPRGADMLARWVGLGFSLATLTVAGLVLYFFSVGPYGPLGSGIVSGPPLQFVDQLSWLPAFGASYLVGVDGSNLWMLLLTSLLTPFAILATWSRFARRVRLMLALLLFMESAFLGVYLAQDMLLFYVFYEAALIPAVLLIGVWGEHGRGQAATRMFLYTFAGSVLMLIGIIALHVLHRSAIVVSDPSFTGTFDLGRITADLRSGAFTLAPTAERLIFGAFFAAFAVKMALWPFHTWLPDAYATAPTPAVIMLAALMSKFGAYGLIRFNLTLFPETAAWAAPAIATLAVIGVLYAAVTAFAQRDMQRLIAYASISHMNMIALGIFALNANGIGGALFQMVSHGINTCALLLIVAVIYERREVRELDSLGGLWKVMPAYAGLSLLILLATIGLPGLNGFVGEFTMLQGVLGSAVLGWPFAIGAVLGVILAAAYALRLFRDAFMGEVTISANQALLDLSRRERLALGLLALVIVAGGLFPNLVLAPLRGTVDGLLIYIEPAVAAVGRMGL